MTQANPAWTLLPLTGAAVSTAAIMYPVDVLRGSPFFKKKAEQNWFHRFQQFCLHEAKLILMYSI